MKRTAAALLCLLALVFSACGTSDAVPTPAPLPASEGLRIAVASDLHFAPDNTDKKANLGAVAYNPEFIDALLCDAADQGAELMLLTGDIVNLGRREHHEALAEKAPRGGEGRTEHLRPARQPRSRAHHAAGVCRDLRRLRL